MKNKISQTEGLAMFQYLDKLRESGAVNMFGATPHLMQKFSMNKNEARTVLSSWMRSKGARS